MYKLEKLKNKQLPLLYKSETKPYIQSLGISPEQIKQYVYFKAQLFVPYKSQKSNFDGINKACICGFYITIHELADFNTYSFYMPNKHDWICPIDEQVDWINHHAFISKIEECKLKKQAPLCWFKSPKGELSKCFVYFEKEE